MMIMMAFYNYHEGKKEPLVENKILCGQMHRYALALWNFWMYVQYKNIYQIKESLKIYVNPKFSTVIDEVDEVM